MKRPQFHPLPPVSTCAFKNTPTPTLNGLASAWAFAVLLFKKFLILYGDFVEVEPALMALKVVINIRWVRILCHGPTLLPVETACKTSAGVSMVFGIG